MNFSTAPCRCVWGEMPDWRSLGKMRCWHLLFFRRERENAGLTLLKLNLVLFPLKRANTQEEEGNAAANPEDLVCSKLLGGMGGQKGHEVVPAHLCWFVDHRNVYSKFFLEKADAEATIVVHSTASEPRCLSATADRCATGTKTCWLAWSYSFRLTCLQPYWIDVDFPIEGEILP